jgi:hypothetical protein
MTIADFLPMLPWEGPPLPRFLGILWPRVRGGEQFLPLTTSRRYLTAVEKAEKAPAPQEQPTSQALTTYENLEEIEFPEGFDPETFMPRKIVIHRKAKEAR